MILICLISKEEVKLPDIWEHIRETCAEPLGLAKEQFILVNSDRRTDDDNRKGC